jgi:hypothetical protein
MAILITGSQCKEFSVTDQSFSIFDRWVNNNCFITPLTNMSGMCPAFQNRAKAVARRRQQHVIVRWPFVGRAILVFPAHRNTPTLEQMVRAYFEVKAARKGWHKAEGTCYDEE